LLLAYHTSRRLDLHKQPPDTMTDNTTGREKINRDKNTHTAILYRQSTNERTSSKRHNTPTATT